MKKKLLLQLKLLGFSLLLFFSFQNVNAQQVSIGTAVTDPGGVPWDPYYGYTYAQSIYYSSEINASGNITSISYYFTGTSLSNSNDLTVWMGNVAKTFFTSTGDWVPVSSLTQVFSGTITNPGAAGWVTITLTTPFPYNGTDNLLIAIDENAANYNSSSDGFQAGALIGTNRSLYYRSDATNPDPNAPVAGTLTDNVPNIQINGLTPFTCQPPTGLVTANLGAFSTDITWTAPATPPAQGYEWAVYASNQGASSATAVSSGTSATLTANVTGLTSNTSYTAFVRSKCGATDYSGWLPLNFTTNISCPAPSALQANNVTTTAADLNWTENGSATAWQIEWGVGSFTQGTGTRVYLTSKPHNLAPLTPATGYSYFVRAVCGPGDTSSWSSRYSFATACNVFTAPYSQTFDVSATPTCWTNNSAGEQWLFTLNPTYAAGVTDHTGTNGYYAWVDDSSPHTSSVELVSPVIDKSALTTPRLRFYVFSNNTNSSANNNLVVEVLDGSTWTTLGTINQNFGAVWQEFTYSLSGVTANNIQVRFVVNEIGTGFYHDIVIDDIFIENTPTCLAVTSPVANNVTATSAELGWTSPAAQFQVEYGMGNFTLGTGTRIVTPNNPYTWSSLTPGTVYGYFVRAICAPGDTSIWSSRVNFTTLCAVITPPYIQDFINYTPACWDEQEGPLGTSTVLTGTSSAWLQDDWLNVAANGKAARINLYNLGDADWLVSPSFNLGSTGNSYALECDVAIVDYGTSTPLGFGADDSLAIVISTDNGATWSSNNILAVWTSANSTLPGGTAHIWIPLSAYGGTVKFGLYGSEGVVDDPTDIDVMVDNFKIAAIPLSVDLQGISAQNVGERNRVDWKTAKEDRGDVFGIERSIDGENFTAIGSTDATGSPSSYTFWDERPAAGVNYYRLKFIDLAGKIKYSSVVKATLASSGNFVVDVYPNPATDIVKIKAYGETDGVNATLLLTDVTGKVIFRSGMVGTQTEINMSGLNSGIYFIKYLDGIHDQTIKINKL